jgi:acyl carrier protein
MSAMERESFTRALLAWLNRRLAPPGERIERDTHLFAGGLINSLRVLELIAWIERETGREIPDRMIRMDHFHTVERIAEVFLPEAAHVGA